ncbi:hypothetical protein FIV42_19770 [Persicimonas caeni]|uniref:Uncharacterized protein n=1 Tax=Persicimonas caeni TaxID=2292766 RepID=A0A4Y6PX40_PERCE|nr:hypothetical protein [Persicimonas caeni]QDG52898.1 hypothetical protein FIV42_19770 [Persicimonas caeni]QED34120.1 hypothetical protein FRD00_19765 [Persicimonas caeni]
MFHIKTDIRQYKCETTAKVERLIRNWVIRPSDLIYNADEKTWSPIGQHPAFDDIFAVIEQEEANEPDTIVTEAPSEVGAEHEVEPGAELEGDLEADGGGLHADSEEITNVTEAPSEPAADDDETTDVREDPRAAHTDEQDAVPAPPEAPEDVEGLIRDSDEITMMTDKTLEMMREEAGEPALEEEEAAEEPTQVVDCDEVLEEDSEPAEASDDADEPDETAEAVEAEKSTGKGRHGLPEEVFVTDEIPRQNVQQAVLDELGELEEEVDEDVEDDEVTEVVNQEEKRPRWRIVMSDDVDDEAESDEDFEEDESGDAVEEDESADEALEDDEHEETLEEESDEDLDEMLDEAAELVGLGEDSESDPVDIDGVDLEPVEDEPRERAETPVKAVEVEEFVSEGYKLPLPVDISPSAEDIRLGLKHSRVGKRAKDAVFPYPEPKKKGEVAKRVFDLDPEDPKDHSLFIVAAFVIGMLVLIVGAVTFFG